MPEPRPPLRVMADVDKPVVVFLVGMRINRLTYVAGPGAVESLYVDSPPGFGLGGAVGTVPVSGAPASARQRRDRRTSVGA